MKTTQEINDSVKTFDWYRVGRPQADGYDTDVLATLESARWGWEKLKPEANAITLCEGTVLVNCEGSSVVHMARKERVFPEDINWTDKMTEGLNKWPAGYRSLQYFLDEFWPFRSGMSQYGRGCASGHHQIDTRIPRHAVYVTVDDTFGCCQGIYHEAGHARLEAMGLAIEDHDFNLLLNPPEELYDSSVRFDKKRPMSAVIHGVYAWLMFTENDWHLFQVHQSVEEFEQYAQRNLPKIEKGVAEIKANARWTPEGEAFIQGLYDWADELVDKCYADTGWKRI